MRPVDKDLLGRVAGKVTGARIVRDRRPCAADRVDERTGVLFCGDLFVTGGVTGVMSHENPFDSIELLRTVASLEPTWMLTGHARALEAPAAALRAKADAIERAAQQALALHARGTDVAAIVRSLFRHGQRKDRRMRWFTSGEFGRENFVRACLAHPSV